MSMSTANPSSTPAMSVFWENVRTILYALALAMVLRFTIAQPFRIPSGSMQPTLQVGDYIVVTKWSYGYGRYSFAPLDGLLPHGRLFAHAPNRGDVVVFRPPPEPDRDFIKRVIGLPGDRIALRDGVVSINGAPVALKADSSGEVENDDGSRAKATRFLETLPGNRRHAIFKLMPHNLLDNFGEVTVPPGHLFVMGDNRDNSADSRVPLHEGGVGMLPVDNLVGRVEGIVGSWDLAVQRKPIWTWPQGLRLSRFFSSVQ